MARFVSGTVVVVPFPFTNEVCARRAAGKLHLRKLNEIRERFCAAIHES